MKKIILGISTLLAVGLAQAAVIDFGDAADSATDWGTLTVASGAWDANTVTLSKTQDGVQFLLTLSGYSFTDDADIVSSSTPGNMFPFANGAGVGVIDNGRINTGQYITMSVALGTGSELVTSLGLQNMNIRYEADTGTDERVLFDNNGNSVVYGLSDASQHDNYGDVALTGGGVDTLSLANVNTWELSYGLLHTSTDGIVALGQVDLNYEVIPEPATIGMFGMMGAGLLWIRRKFTI